jgi:DNA repair exonuclease SbcCD ATPase subunit
MELKNEENIEKLLALDIEHLKSTNTLENKKIEELKTDFEKSTNLKDYLTKEIQELSDRVKSTENENKQKQIEYEIQKNTLEQKLKSLKSEINSLRKINSKDIKSYSSIENDIKNKISYISLQNNNIIEKYPSKKIDDGETNFIETSAKNMAQDKSNESKELLEFLSNNNIKNLDDLQKKFIPGRSHENSPKAEENPIEDDKAMKDQIMNLLSQINNK